MLLAVVQPSIPLCTPPASPFSLNVTVTSVLFQPATLAAGAFAGVGALGGVLSIFMPMMVDGSAALPATSTQLPVLLTEAFSTSAVKVCPATVFVSRPDCTAPASAQVKFTVTSVLFQPLPLAAGVRPPVITGLVLSIFTVTLAIALVLPALSVHVPLTSVPLVSAVRPLPVVQLSIPLLIVPASPLSLKVTATSVLFQPLTLAAGALTAVGGLGGVLSMLMPLTAEESAALPALSRQLPVLVTEAFCTSAVNVCPATLLVSRPDSTAPVSAQVKFTVTSVLFQPLALAAGVRPPVIAGLVDLHRDLGDRAGVARFVCTRAAYIGSAGFNRHAAPCGAAVDSALHRSCVAAAREADRDIRVVPAIGVGRRRPHRCRRIGRGLIDVDAAHRRGIGCVAGLIHATASVGHRLILALSADRCARDGVGVNSGAAGVGASEAAWNVGVVPVVGVGRRRTAACDHRLGLINVDVRDARRRGAIAGSILARTVDGLPRAFGRDGHVQGAGRRVARGGSGGSNRGHARTAVCAV